MLGLCLACQRRSSAQVTMPLTMMKLQYYAASLVIQLTIYLTCSGYLNATSTRQAKESTEYNSRLLKAKSWYVLQCVRRKASIFLRHFNLARDFQDPDRNHFLDLCGRLSAISGGLCCRKGCSRNSASTRAFGRPVLFLSELYALVGRLYKRMGRNAKILMLVRYAVISLSAACATESRLA